MIEAFNNLPNVGIIPELVDIYHQFRFSRGRSYAAKAIQITSPEYFAKNLAFECLWDCEDETRELGAKYVSLDSNDALHRIQNLADDALEETSVRDTAKERLKA